MSIYPCIPCSSGVLYSISPFTKGRVVETVNECIAGKVLSRLTIYMLLLTSAYCSYGWGMGHTVVVSQCIALYYLYYLTRIDIMYSLLATLSFDYCVLGCAP